MKLKLKKLNIKWKQVGRTTPSLKVKELYLADYASHFKQYNIGHFFTYPFQKSKSERKKESIVSWKLPWKKRVKMSQSTESWIEQPSPFQHQKIQNISIGGGLKKKSTYPMCAWCVWIGHEAFTFTNDISTLALRPSWFWKCEFFKLKRQEWWNPLASFPGK